MQIKALNGPDFSSGAIGDDIGLKT